MAKKKTSAELDQEILDSLIGGLGVPRTTRQARFIKAAIESRTTGHVDVTELSTRGGHHLVITHPESGHRETFGVSIYGITPGEVQYGSRFKGGDKFYRAMRAIVNKAKKIT